MKKVGSRIAAAFLLIFASTLVSLANAKATSSAADKITANELVIKHLKAIGSEENLKSFRSLMAIGSSKAVFRVNGTAEITGIVVIASQGEKNMFGMKFNNTEYEYEKFGFDGENVSVGYSKPGVRTPFGEFLLANAKTFKAGILGGVLSNSWELLRFDEKRGKLKYDGEKTIDGVKLHKFSYNPKKGSDLDIKLFFETDSFRHVRSEYTRTVSSTIGRTINDSARQSETRYKMVEEFSAFSAEKGLTLPHNYRIYLELISGKGTGMYDWEMNFREFSFDQELEVSQFRVDSY